MNNRFSNATEIILRKAGWYPNRNVSEIVVTWKAELLKTDKKEMFPEAEKILLEFGGLNIKRNINDKRYSLDYSINPSLAAYESDRFDSFEKELKINLFPLGEAGGGHGFVAVGEDGKIYLLMMNIWFVAYSFDEALENLTLGKVPKFIL